MLAVIHQPHFLPWLGYFNKLALADNFIIQDNVQYRDRYFQNRTLIRSNNESGKRWLTIPVHSGRSTLIKDVQFADPKWKSRLLKSLYHTYHDSKHFDKYWLDFTDIISGPVDNLLDLNTKTLRYFIDILDIEVSISYASEVKRSTYASEDLVRLCLHTRSDSYLFGEGGGMKYHGIEMLKKEGIKLYRQNFLKHFKPISEEHYPSCFNLSILDYLFHLPLDQVKSIVKKVGKAETLPKREIRRFSRV